MKDLKFRAWDGKKMHYNVFPWQWDFVVSGSWHRCEKSTGDGILGSGGDTAEMLVPAIRFKELMQSTGLKDKNNKDVYAGDIVRCSRGCPHVVEWRNEIGGKYTGGMPGWYLSGLISGGGEGYAWTGTEEIIGNVYENPELKNEAL